MYRGDQVKNYTALIIDLKKSRSYSIEDRNSIQNYVDLMLQCLNRLFAHAIVREIEFSAGDEVQGLFRTPQAAYLCLRIFNMLISPVEIRAGIGVGEWNVKVEHASTTAQDGPVYHNARRAINQVKDVTGYSVLFCSGTKQDLFINTVINLPFMLTGSYSGYQNELMLLTELLYPIDFEQLIDYSKTNEIFKLAQSKDKVYYYQNDKRGGAAKRYPFEGIEDICIEPVPADAADEQSDFYITSGKKRGMTTRLSQVLGISRQSIEKTFKTAKVIEARNAAVAALKFMDQYL